MLYPAHYLRLWAAVFGAIAFFAASVPGVDWPPNTTLPYKEGLIIALQVMFVVGLAGAVLLYKSAREIFFAMLGVGGGVAAALSGYWMTPIANAPLRGILALIVAYGLTFAAVSEKASLSRFLWAGLFPAALFAATYGVFAGYPAYGVPIAASFMLIQFMWVPAPRVLGPSFPH